MLVIGTEWEKRREITQDEKLITKARKNYLQKIIMIGRYQKDGNVKGSFAIKDAGNIKGMKVLLVDDLYDFCSTANECTAVLKKQRRLGTMRCV